MTVSVFRLAAACLYLLCSVAASMAQTRVDLELVLAVDVSLSMDLDEQRLQRDGYIAAFRDPEVVKAISSGPLGRIAVTYIEWAGPSNHQVVVEWTLIDGAAAAEALAARLEKQQISRARMTSISSALEFSGQQLRNNGFEGTRKVIDVSGDGPNNAGAPVVPVRDGLVAQGIIINGLPIMLKVDGAGSFFDITNLDAYYESCVIGGQGAFVIPIREKEAFAPAIRRKLILEISDFATAPRVIPAQAQSAGDPVDCLIGEKLWRRYMDGTFR